MQIRIRLNSGSRQSLVERLQQAYDGGHLRLVKRIHALLCVVDGTSVAQVCRLLHLGEQTVRDYICTFLLKGVDSLSYQRPSGRPPKLTRTQRKELADLITAGPEAAGYASGCWTAIVIQDLILCHFGVEYHPQYICSLLDNMGFSFQKARLPSHSPDFNPIEFLWKKVRKQATHLKCFPEVERNQLKPVVTVCSRPIVSYGAGLQQSDQWRTPGASAGPYSPPYFRRVTTIPCQV
jgi:transposase